MAKKVNIAEVTAKTKAELLEDIKKYVSQWNESAMFSEFKVMKALEKKMSEAVEKYTAECERECFRELEKAENPMYAAAMTLTFKTVKVKEVKKKGADGKPTGEVEMTTEETVKRIDPYRLHEFVKDGIGADKSWSAKVERLNMLFTAAMAAELNAKDKSGNPLNPTVIRDTIAMSEEARKISLKSEGKAINSKTMLTNLQSVIDAMIGEGYEATPSMVAYLKACHSRAGRESLTVVCSNKRTMRQYMLDCCHAAITGNAYVLDYKKSKKK